MAMEQETRALRELYRECVHIFRSKKILTRHRCQQTVRNAEKKTYTLAACVLGREKALLKTKLRAGLFKWTQIYTPLCFGCNLYVDTLSLLCVLTYTSFALHLLTTERYTQYTWSQKKKRNEKVPKRFHQKQTRVPYRGVGESIHIEQVQHS